MTNRFRKYNKSQNKSKKATKPKAKEITTVPSKETKCTDKGKKPMLNTNGFLNFEPLRSPDTDSTDSGFYSDGPVIQDPSSSKPLYFKRFTASEKNLSDSVTKKVICSSTHPLPEETIGNTVVVFSQNTNRASDTLSNLESTSSSQDTKKDAKSDVHHSVTESKIATVVKEGSVFDKENDNTGETPDDSPNKSRSSSISSEVTDSSYVTVPEEPADLCSSSTTSSIISAFPSAPANLPEVLDEEITLDATNKVINDHKPKRPSSSMKVLHNGDTLLPDEPQENLNLINKSALDSVVPFEGLDIPKILTCRSTQPAIYNKLKIARREMYKKKEIYETQLSQRYEKYQSLGRCLIVARFNIDAVKTDTSQSIKEKKYVEKLYRHQNGLLKVGEELKVITSSLYKVAMTLVDLNEQIHILEDLFKNRKEKKTGCFSCFEKIGRRIFKCS